MNTKINIDLKIYKDFDLGKLELLTLALIVANTDENNISHILNEEIAKVLDVSLTSTTRYIKFLDRKDLIKREFVYKNSHGKTRIIKLTQNTRKYIDG